MQSFPVYLLIHKTQDFCTALYTHVGYDSHVQTTTAFYSLTVSKVLFFYSLKLYVTLECSIKAIRAGDLHGKIKGRTTPQRRFSLLGRKKGNMIHQQIGAVSWGDISGTCAACGKNTWPWCRDENLPLSLLQKFQSLTELQQIQLKRTG